MAGNTQKHGRNKRNGRADAQAKRTARNKARAVALEKARGNLQSGCPATYPSLPAQKPKAFTVQTTGSKPEGARVGLCEQYQFQSPKAAPRGWFSVQTRAESRGGL